ncbi:hypothetical protein FBU30_005460 [Linnemannia zychae]|nr:hypothetical protein FBU30_005460 [Linnemannia zychae]
MSPSLYRFPTAEGLVHLLDRKHINTVPTESDIAPIPHNISSSAAPEHLQVDAVHYTNLNGVVPMVSDYAIKEISSFDHVVCDFDETITDHDTTSSFDTLACKIRPGTDYQEPQMTWPEILQAYLDDLEKVDVGDLCHLNRPLDSQLGSCETAQAQTGENSSSEHLHHPKPASTTTKHTIQPPSKEHHLLDPKVRELKCHIDGRTFTPEPELPVPKIASLQPWLHSQVRKRAVEKVSLDRVYESGNLVGLTKSQIRQFGREHIKLRPGVVAFLRAFVKEQDQLEQELKDKASQSKAAKDEETDNSRLNSGSGSETAPLKHTRGHIWILSVNWSQDLIRGAMDQVFGSEEATSKYLPESHLICSNLEFAEEGHEILTRRRKSDTTASNTTIDSTSQKKENECVHLSSGKVEAKILTGTDKLHAFQGIQRRYANQHDLALTDTKWAFLGDSLTDLGCLVEADVGIIIGKSKSLLSECERSGIQVVDLIERK